MNYSLPDRLAFQLPDFTRIAWTSDATRKVWEPRIERIGRAWYELGWQSVALGMRACFVASLSADDYLRESARWIERGLVSIPLRLYGRCDQSYSTTPEPPKPGEPVGFRVAVGNPAALKEYQRAWSLRDHDKMGELLGYPACCRSFFNEVWIESQCLDTTWPMASNGRSTKSDGLTLVVGGRPETNILLRWMNVRAVNHLPCSFECDASVEVAQAYLSAARRCGFEKEMDWTAEMLSWPVEWSALHGIAEIKTPVARVSSRTDATANKYVVRRETHSYPEQGAHGLRFPYRPPDRLLVSDSPAFRRAMASPLVSIGNASPPEWVHQDNGFSSRSAMDQAHEPLIALASKHLTSAAGSVLDLGCGNGELLRKLSVRCPGFRSVGIDTNDRALEHARQTFHERPGSFIAGNLFKTDLWLEHGPYELAFLMVGRLLEVPPPQAEMLLKSLREHSRHILLYAYSGYGGRSFDQLLRAAGISAGVEAERFVRCLAESCKLESGAPLDA